MPAGDHHETIARFVQAMQRRDLVPPARLIADGRLHRCDAAGKRGKRDGAYLLHLNGAVPAGGLQNFRDDIGWQTWSDAGNRKISDSERREIERRHKEAKAQRDAATAADARRAADKAQRIWASAPPAPKSHPYLARKQVEPHGLRIKYGCLIAPIRDVTATMHGLQFIDAHGAKRFLKGGRVKGGHFRIAGDSKRTVLVEGFATGASVREATGHTTLIAFNSANLLAVAEAIHEAFPTLTVVIAADDDHRTNGNPGLIWAIRAARVADALVAVPDFGPSRRDSDTDFNDVAIAIGAGAIRRALDEAVTPDVLLTKILLADPHSAHAPGFVEELAALKARDSAAFEKLRDQLKQSGVRVGTLDREIARVASREIQTTETADDLLFPHWEIQPWPDPIDTTILLDTITARIRRHVVLTGDQAAVVVLWILLTWVHDEVAVHSPILAATSAEPDSGKSTLCGVVSFVVKRSLLTVSVSGAALFRAVEKWHPTIVADEADKALLNDDLASVINSGWTRGQGALRCHPETLEPVVFSTFAPKMISGKRLKLPDTTWSRTITIKLERKRSSERVQNFAHIDDDGLIEVRRQCARWADDNVAKLAVAEPEAIPGFENRRGANWTLMLAIAELAGAGWKAKARQAAVAIDGTKDIKRASLAVQLLAEMRDIFERIGDDCILSRDLLSDLKDDHEKPWATYNKKGKPISLRQIAALLGDFGIISETVRPYGGSTGGGKGYHRTRFIDPWERYLPPNKRPNADGTSNCENDKRPNAYNTSTSSTSDNVNASAAGTSATSEGVKSAQKHGNSGNFEHGDENSKTSKRPNACGTGTSAQKDPQKTAFFDPSENEHLSYSHGHSDAWTDKAVGEPEGSKRGTDQNAHLCAQCNSSDGKEELNTGPEFSPTGVWLHPECKPFWLERQLWKR